MKNFFVTTTLIFLFWGSSATLASQTTSQYFTGNMTEFATVAQNGGNLSATIDTSSGALSTSFSPIFKMTTNSRGPKTLTMSATVKTTSGDVNSIFHINSTRYIILGNISTLPTPTAISDITGGSPTANNNANAIAYPINEPTVPSGLVSAYDSTNKKWNLTLTQKGATTASITVPAGNPLPETYLENDTAGTYQTVITLTFL